MRKPKRRKLTTPVETPQKLENYRRHQGERPSIAECYSLTNIDREIFAFD